MENYIGTKISSEDNILWCYRKYVYIISMLDYIYSKDLSQYYSFIIPGEQLSIVKH